MLVGTKCYGSKIEQGQRSKRTLVPQEELCDVNSGDQIE